MHDWHGVDVLTMVLGLRDMVVLLVATKRFNGCQKLNCNPIVSLAGMILALAHLAKGLLPRGL